MSGASDTLPPGWTGNDADHHTEIGPFTIGVRHPSYYNPFAKQHQRTGNYIWFVNCGQRGSLLAQSESPPTSTSGAEARRAALTSLLALLTAATREAEMALAGLIPTEP